MNKIVTKSCHAHCEWCTMLKTVKIIDQSAKTVEIIDVFSMFPLCKCPAQCGVSLGPRFGFAPESCHWRAHLAMQLARCCDDAGKDSSVQVVMKLSAENTLNVRQVQKRQLVMYL